MMDLVNTLRHGLADIFECDVYPQVPHLRINEILLTRAPTLLLDYLVMNFEKIYLKLDYGDGCSLDKAHVSFALQKYV
jgi:hypothetical protein